MKLFPALAGAVLVVGALAGCGGDNGGGDGQASETENYCDSLRQAKSDFESLSESDLSELGAAFDRMQEIGAEAPAEVRDEWEVMTSLISDLEAGLEDAGLSWKDLDELSSGQVPEGVDTKKLMELGTKMENFDQSKLEDASKKIEKHAKQQCDIDLGE